MQVTVIVNDGSRNRQHRHRKSERRNQQVSQRSPTPASQPSRKQESWSDRFFNAGMALLTQATDSPCKAKYRRYMPFSSRP